MFPVNIDRPLAIIDIEATGLNSRADRIVELCIIRLEPDGSRKVHTYRINPEMPIPADATQIHGISDADVKDCPTFDDLADELFKLVEDCDFGGYNMLGFDLPLLAEEFFRARRKFDTTERRVIDAQRIFHKREPRDLSAALQFFCGRRLEGAHGAEADAVATEEVIKGQFERYPDLPADIAALDAYCNPRDPAWADARGRITWQDGELVINFGKKKGAVLKDLAATDPGYLKWILKSDFPRDTQEIVRRALDGDFPDAPSKDLHSDGA
jgi:DNA polymerase-3 subunit epsilon